VWTLAAATGFPTGRADCCHGTGRALARWHTTRDAHVIEKDVRKRAKNERLCEGEWMGVRDLAEIWWRTLRRLSATLDLG